ncbi:hypothetical protein LXL04_007307 [Taraxacum kok-saghyz]
MVVDVPLLFEAQDPRSIRETNWEIKELEYSLLYLEATINERVTAAIGAAQLHHHHQREFSYKDFSACSPPLFTGSTNPITCMRWISDVEGTFLTRNCPENAKVRCASNLLRDAAKDRWSTWTKAMTNPEIAEMPWADFVTRFRVQYVPQVEMDRLAREFLTLEQTTESIPELNRKFNEMALFCPQYAADEGMKIARYTQMLRTDIREFVVAYPRSSLAELMDAARRREMEVEMQVQKRKATQALVRASSGSKKAKTYDTRSGQESGGRGPPAGVERTGPVGCYKCGKTGHMSRDCRMTMIACFECGQLGHKRTECPQLRTAGGGGAPNAPTAAAPMRITDGRTGPSRPPLTGQGRVYQLTADEAPTSPSTMEAFCRSPTHPSLFPATPRLLQSLPKCTLAGRFVPSILQLSGDRFLHFQRAAACFPIGTVPVTLTATGHRGLGGSGYWKAIWPLDPAKKKLGGLRGYAVGAEGRNVSDARSLKIEGVKDIIDVASGKGGVGKSTSSVHRGRLGQIHVYTSHIENARKVLDEMPKGGWWMLILECQEIEYCFQIYSLFGALYVMLEFGFVLQLEFPYSAPVSLAVRLAVPNCRSYSEDRFMDKGEDVILKLDHNAHDHEVLWLSTFGGCFWHFWTNLPFSGWLPLAGLDAYVLFGITSHYFASVALSVSVGVCLHVPESSIQSGSTSPYWAELDRGSQDSAGLRDRSKDRTPVARFDVWGKEGRRRRFSCIDQIRALKGVLKCKSSSIQAIGGKNIILELLDSKSTTTGPITRSKSRGVTNLVSEPLVMTNPSEELIMKKLEAFMIQQTQSTSELKAAVADLQAKQTTLEEGLSAQNHNQSHKRTGSDTSVDEEMDMESNPFGDPPEQGYGRGRGASFGSAPAATIVIGRGRGLVAGQPVGSVRVIGKETESWRAGWDDHDDIGYRGNRVPRFAKMEFPTYDGKTDPLEWLQRCVDFFEEQQTPADLWVRQATFSLQGRASGWYHNLRRMRDRLTWREFSEECKIRFGPPMSLNPLGELARLRQLGTVEDYCEAFESRLGRTTGVTPEQSIWHFCAGLTNAIRYEVEYARPNTLYFAMNLARQIELKLSEAGQMKSFGAPSSSRSSTINRNRDTTGMGPTRREPRNPAWKRLTSSEMAERRAKGLCFNCDEMFSAGHKCAKLFCIMLADEEEDTPEDAELDVTPEISLNAIRGEKTDKTFQVRAVIGSGMAWVLLDSGSTHNFIAKRAAEQLQIPVQYQPGLRVALPDGGKLASSGISRNLQMAVQGYEFSADFFAIPLEGFDIVLGIHWLKRLGHILWDFTVREMEFTIEGRDDNEPNLDKLLESFSDIFEKPQGLPPSRTCDHQIRLHTGTEPVAVRPYRYPHLLKDEIEKQCTEMLQIGTIRSSQYPFSSPVLLVKKHDGSWRFCVDYRELNAKTIKDKFPIPVVDELLDELHGETFFSKLDLASGYHQVRMAATDIEKTAFRTHHWHFEFLVMPFGLSNAPSTFQSLMNDVFRQQLLKIYKRTANQIVQVPKMLFRKTYFRN